MRRTINRIRKGTEFLTQCLFFMLRSIFYVMRFPTVSDNFFIAAVRFDQIFPADQSAGGDNMDFHNTSKLNKLLYTFKTIYSNLQIRDIFIRYVVDLNSRGEYIVSKLDRRIYEK